MAQPPSPSKQVSDPRIAKLIELETRGVIKPEHRTELNTYRAQGLAPAAPSGGNESERTAAFLATRVGGGVDDINRALKDHPGTEKPEWDASIFGWNDTMRNNLNSSGRQRIEAAQTDVLDAALTLGTGAAYSPEQLAGYRQSYFPQLGDADETVADKRVRLRRLLEAARIKAGGAAPDIDKALAAIDADGVAKTEAPATPGQSLEMNADIPDRLKNPLSPEQQAAYDAWNKANPKASADQLKAFVGSLGVGIDNADAIVKARDDGYGLAVGADAQRKVTPIDLGDGATGAAVRGAGDAITVGLLPRATATVQALKNGTTYGEELTRQQGIEAFDEANHGIARFGGELAGGVAGGFLVPGAGARTAGQLARTGGGLGALYGINKSEDLTDIPNVIKNGVVGGMTGAAAGYGLGKLGDLYRGRFGGPTPPAGPTGNKIVDAADRLVDADGKGFPLMTADVRPGARGVTSFLESVPLASGAIRRRAAKGTQFLEDRVGELAADTPVPGRMDVGETVQQGAENWVRRSSDVGGKLYSRAQDLSGGKQIDPRAALDEIDAHLADLARTPSTNKGKIDILKSVRADMTDAAGNPKPLDIDSIRAIRTNAREQMDAGSIRSRDLDRRLDSVMDAVGQDIAGGLAANPRALGAYQRADAFWRDRATRVDNVLSTVIGKADNKISGEDVMSRIEGMAAPSKGKGRRLTSLMSSLRPDEREQVAAHISGSLGRATPESDFSANTLFTQLKKLSPQARTAIFGQKGAQALADLATVAEKRASTVKDFNITGSGRVGNYWRALQSLVTGGGAGAGLGLVGAGSAAAGGTVGASLTAGALGVGNITARVLTNPAFARWAAQGFKQTTMKGAKASINRLGNVATSNPGIRAEVLQIQKALSQAVNDNAPNIARAAASDGKGPDDEQ